MRTKKRAAASRSVRGKENFTTSISSRNRDQNKTAESLSLAKVNIFGTNSSRNSEKQQDVTKIGCVLWSSSSSSASFYSP
eukprot:760208-Hanusia_phi.AAC.4